MQPDRADEGVSFRDELTPKALIAIGGVVLFAIIGGVLRVAGLSSATMLWIVVPLFLVTIIAALVVTRHDKTQPSGSRAEHRPSRHPAF